MKIDHSFQFTVLCKKCHCELEAELTKINGVNRLMVSTCNECLSEAEQAGMRVESNCPREADR